MGARTDAGIKIEREDKLCPCSTGGLKKSQTRLGTLRGRRPWQSPTYFISMYGDRFAPLAMTELGVFQHPPNISIIRADLAFARKTVSNKI
jgi:hypothetical protein